MKFHQLTQYLLKLEQTSKRLEITDILSNLIKELTADEISEAVYLIMGQLNALYENKKFNIAERMMVRILEYSYSTPQKVLTDQEITKLFNKIGDLGDTAFELADKNKKSNLTILQVYEKLAEIAKTDGSGSQETKVKKTSALLKELDSTSAKFVVRIILNTTRLGFTELTFIDALAKFVGDKALRPKIEAVYSVHPDIGLIAKSIKEHGIKGLSKIKLETGVPLLSQKPQRIGTAEEAIEKMGTVWAEYKFDGTRVQLHIDRNKPGENNDSDQSSLFASNNKQFLIRTYTRNLEETSHQYPDIAEAAVEQINAKSVIIDGEAIGYDTKTGEFLSFQETMQRKRKHDIGDMAKNIPLKYFAFDIMYLDGQSLIDKPLRERKKILKQIVKPGNTIVVDEHFETDNADKLYEYYSVAKEKGLEGLIAKRPDDPYQAGARSWSWVKLKRADERLLEDSIDCVVLGYYAGRGVRSKFGIGGFLAGVYDPKTDTFKTLTKVGTGLTDEEFGTLKKLCDKVKTNKLPSNVTLNKTYMPDVITLPKIVVELGGDELSISQTHSAGYALRFPRLLKFRDDKAPTESTSTDEIAKIYKKQKRGSY